MSVRIVVAVAFAVAWALVSGSFTIPNLLFGLVLGAAALWMVRDERVMEGVRIRPLRVILLAGVFVVELLKSGWRVAMMVLRPTIALNPAIIAYPLTVRRDFEITLLANLITLTPGTLSVDVSEDRRTLFVHCVDAVDADAVVADIRGSFEQRIEEAFR